MVMMGSSESGLDPNPNKSSANNEEDEGGTTTTTHSQNPNITIQTTTYTITNNNSTSNIQPEDDEIRSQLQIQIGPNGGTTISASRRRNHSNNEADQMTKDLIAAQLERKEKLMRALLAEQSRVNKLRAEIGLLRSKLHPFPNLERLKDDNQRLRIECDLMTREVDLYDNGTVPLGELNPEFYRDINPGQDANALFLNTNPSNKSMVTSISGRRPTGSRANSAAPPPRPPPPRFLPIPKLDSPSGEWCCTVCTFQNHPQLSQCEQCDMIRVLPSPAMNSPAVPR